MSEGSRQSDVERAEAGMRAMVFEVPLRVQEGDIDGLNHANNVVYLRWVQEAATAHWQACATLEQQQSLVWVALRHEIDYLRPAFLGEALTARTWVGEASGARFERFVEIARPSDGQVLAKVRSVWCALDAQTGRPRRVEEALRLRFFETVLHAPAVHPVP